MNHYDYPIYHSTHLPPRYQSTRRTGTRRTKRNRRTRTGSHHNFGFRAEVSVLPTDDPNIFTIRFTTPHAELLLSGSPEGIRIPLEELTLIANTFNNSQYTKIPKRQKTYETNKTTKK